MALDHKKLVNVKSNAKGWGAACPACQAVGADQTGNHLQIFPDGKWSCATAPSDKPHNQLIWALAGDGATSEFTFLPQEEVLPKIEIERTWPAEVLDRLMKDHSYWIGRGISEATVAPFRGGVAGSHQLAGRYVFPIFNDDDQIIGFTGRALHPDLKPKWRHMEGCQTSRWVWGGLDEIDSVREIILVESIGDALKLIECGYGHVLCLFGTKMSQVVLGKIISANPTKITVATNRDEAKYNPATGARSWPGQEAAAKIKATLLKFFDEEKVHVVFPPEGATVKGEVIKDWGAATCDQIRLALTPLPSS